MVNFIIHFTIPLLALTHHGVSQPTGFVEIQNHEQFENLLTDKQMKETNDIFWSWRSEASRYKTLRLEDETGKYIAEFTICVDPITAGTNVSLQLENIRYANDGPTDIVQVSLNGYVFAIFNTFEKWGSGHEWNIFHNSGRLGGPQEVGEGEHILHVAVRTDKYGLELDRLTMNAVNQNPDTRLLCGGRLVII